MRPARYRPAPSYNDRLRVALLIDTWDRASRRSGAIDTIEALSRRLSDASATLAARLGVPAALLRRAAAERQLDVAAEEQLRRQIRRGMIGFADDDIRRLALTVALEGGADLGEKRCSGTARRRCACCCARIAIVTRQARHARMSNRSSRACVTSSGRPSPLTITTSDRGSTLQRRLRRWG